MITINSNEEAKALIKDGVLAVDDDLEIAYDGFKINANIKCKNIYSKNGRRGIKAYGINAHNLDVEDIKAHDLDVGDINARDLDVTNIYARDLNVLNIKAHNINYYAVCFVHQNITCTSIKGQHPNAKHFCLDGGLTIIGETSFTLTEGLEFLGHKAKLLETKVAQLSKKGEKS